MTAAANGKRRPDGRAATSGRRLQQISGKNGVKTAGRTADIWRGNGQRDGTVLQLMKWKNERRMCLPSQSLLLLFTLPLPPHHPWMFSSTCGSAFRRLHRHAALFTCSLLSFPMIFITAQATAKAVNDYTAGGGGVKVGRRSHRYYGA